MFFDDNDVEERQVAFDCLVKVVAKHKEMCCSSAVLNFLGFGILGDKEYFKVLIDNAIVRFATLLLMIKIMFNCRQGVSICKRERKEKWRQRRRRRL